MDCSKNQLILEMPQVAIMCMKPVAPPQTLGTTAHQGELLPLFRILNIVGVVSRNIEETKSHFHYIGGFFGVLINDVLGDGKY